MPRTTITEGSATIHASTGQKISKDLEVFYNPVMQKNRDLSILLLRALGRKNLRLADPLAGSGIRALRFLKELPADMIKEIYVNDYKHDFEMVFNENAKLSLLDTEQRDKVHVNVADANKFLLENPSCDYIDIDPFGSPNPFLDSACKKVFRKGVLAVTATDTAPLCGTYPKACMRKYWAKPRRDYMMHEWGLRILIRKCQLIAAQYEKALIPIFSYSLDHYFRVFFQVDQGKAKVDAVLAEQGSLDGFGPAWLGSLGDAKLVTDMLQEVAQASSDTPFKQYEKILTMLRDEFSIAQLGFYAIHDLAKKLKIGSPPPRELIVHYLEEKGFKTCRTHFSPTGMKVNGNQEEMESCLLYLSKHIKEKGARK